MMDVKLNSTDVHEKMDDGNADKLQLLDSATSDQQAHVNTDSINAVNPTQSNQQINQQSDMPRAVSICSPGCAEKDKPKLFPASIEACTVYEANKSFTSAGRAQEILENTSVQTQPDETKEDFCAAILLACLFCHPLDCLLATMRGCNQCVWSLCSYLCGCEPATLQPLLDVTHNCDLCRCLCPHCFLCDCSTCDVCLQATECLDLAMEMSQILYH